MQSKFAHHNVRASRPQLSPKEAMRRRAPATRENKKRSLVVCLNHMHTFVLTHQLDSIESIFTLCISWRRARTHSEFEPRGGGRPRLSAAAPRAQVTQSSGTRAAI